MKKILLISFFLLQFSLYSQNVSKWNIGIEFSTDDLSISNGNYNDFLVTQGNVNGYSIEFDKTNYSIGLTTQYKIRSKLGVSSGILYSNKDFTGTFSCGSCESTSFPVYPPEKLKQRFIVIPVSIDYTLLKGNLKPIVRAGFKNNLEIENDLKEQSKGYFLEAFIGALINYEFLNNWNVGIGYNYQFALTDLYETDEYNLRTNNYYLQFSYRIK